MKIRAILFGLFALVSSAHADLNNPARGTGTVTSVGLTPVASIMTAGGPVVTTGNLVETLISQTANTVWAAPNGSSGPPVFRSIVSADMTACAAGTNLLMRCVVADGADPTGVADSTAAVNTSLASGALDVYFPAGTYKLCGVTVPHTFYLHIHGIENASKIIQGNCGSPVFQWSTAVMDYSEQIISDLWFDGTSGTNHVINTSGEGGLTLRNLYFNNVPSTFDEIYVNGAASTVEHDDRIEDIRIYASSGSNTANAAIEFGPLVSDSDIDRVTESGNYTIAYGFKLATGITTLRFHNNHIYGNSTNEIFAQSCQNCQFVGNVWDNSTSDEMVLSGVNNSTFVNEQIEAINNTKNGITLTNSQGNNFVNTLWGTASTAANFAVNETGTSDYNSFIGGTINTLADYNATLFSFANGHSSATYVPGYTPLGLNYYLTGTTVSAQATNTTAYLGVNASQASLAATAYVMPTIAVIKSGQITVDTTPAAGQSMTFTFLDGAATMGSCTISNPAVTCTATLNYTVAIADQVAIRSVFSATAGSANIRWALGIRG